VNFLPFFICKLGEIPEISRHIGRKTVTPQMINSFKTTDNYVYHLLLSAILHFAHTDYDNPNKRLLFFKQQPIRRCDADAVCFICGTG
jgi:hypothetical protein